MTSGYRNNHFRLIRIFA